MRQIAIDEINWTIEAEQDWESVRGNAIASGDDEYDKQVEDEIIARLDDGDVWAWAAVEVRGEWNGIEVSDFLGCCSYADEEDFKQPGGYYDDMRNSVRDQIQKMAESIAGKMV